MEFSDSMCNMIICLFLHTFSLWKPSPFLRSHIATKLPYNPFFISSMRLTWSYLLRASKTSLLNEVKVFRRVTGIRDKRAHRRTSAGANRHRIAKTAHHLIAICICVPRHTHWAVVLIALYRPAGQLAVTLPTAMICRLCVLVILFSTTLLVTSGCYHCNLSNIVDRHIRVV